MDGALLYAMGTLAGWAGWFFLLRALWLAAAARFARSDGGKAFRAWPPAAAGGALLLAGAALAPMQGSDGTLGLPIVWFVLPFWGWAAVAGSLFAVYRALQSGTAAGPERRSRLFQAATWAGVAVLAGWGWQADGFSFQVLRGTVRLGAGPLAALLALAVAAVLAMAASLRSHRLHRGLRTAASHLALAAGSIVFGIPFVWLLSTSFKEDRDMSSAEGIIWVPRVSQTAPYFDPDDPMVEAVWNGTTVQGTIVRKNADGSALIDIARPFAMRGMTFTAPAPLKIVPRQVPVVRAEIAGAVVEGRVVREFEDGGVRLEVQRAVNRAGELLEFKPGEFEPVREVGLRTDNYREALEFLPLETQYGLVYLRNTLLIVVLSVIGTVLSSSLVAYAFARMSFPLKQALFVLLLSTMMLPAAVTMLPTFLIFRSLGWVDTLNPLWVPAFFGSAFNIFLLRQFFASIPLELEDAAKIDGSSYLRTYWTVMMPQIRPALAFVAVTTVLAAWNNFMGPLVYISSPEKMTVSYAVQLYQSDRFAEPGLLMAFTMMAMLPILLLFVFAQKYFIEGVTLSGFGGR